MLTKLPCPAPHFPIHFHKCDPRKFLDILKKKMKTRDKRRSLAIASIPYKWRRSCHAIDDLPKPGDPAYDEQGVLRGTGAMGERWSVDDNLGKKKEEGEM